jgi:hypothetical protein
MPLTSSKQKNGLLTIDGVEYGCQARNIRIVPPDQPDDASDEVLCGDLIPSDDAAAGWVLAITSIQDFTDPDGFTNYMYDNQGDTVPFVWKPTAAAFPTYSGTLLVWPAEVGGDVNKRLESEQELKLTGKPVRADA